MYLRFVCFQGVFEIAMRGVALRQSFLVMLDTEKALQPPHLSGSYSVPQDKPE